MTDRSAPTRGDLFEQCLRFIEEQSSGEWGEDLETSDARKLMEFVQAQRLAAIEECAKAIEAEAEQRTDAVEWATSVILAESVRNLGRGV